MVHGAGQGWGSRPALLRPRRPAPLQTLPCSRPAPPAALQPGPAPSPRRASLDARQEARLCGGYATVRMQPPGLPHAGAGHPPTHALLQQQVPPHWQSLVPAYGATYQHEELLPANSWPASGLATQAAVMARASIDSCLDSGLYGMGSMGAGSEPGLPLLSMDSRHSVDAGLVRRSLDGRHSVDSTSSMAVLALERFSQEVSRLSQDVGRMSFEAARWAPKSCRRAARRAVLRRALVAALLLASAVCTRSVNNYACSAAQQARLAATAWPEHAHTCLPTCRMPPPPTANPYASSLFASAAPGPGASDGAWQAGGQPRGPA